MSFTLSYYLILVFEYFGDHFKDRIPSSLAVLQGQDLCPPLQSTAVVVA